MKYTVYRKNAAISTVEAEHKTLYVCKNRKVKLSNAENGTKFLTLRRSSQLPITIYFDATGGTATYNEVTLSVGTAIGALPTATHQTKTFLGWYNAANEQVTTTDIASVRTQFLSAHWQDLALATFSQVPKPTQLSSSQIPTFQYVEFNPNGGTGGGMVKVKYGENFKDFISQVEVQAPAGKQLDGWWTMRNGGLLTDNEIYDGEWQIVYAHWKDL